MALTYAIEGKGVIAECDALSDTGGGTWTEQGGGTISVSNDVFLYNGGCIGGKYASKSGIQQYNLGTGNELDFTAGTGTEDGQMLYIWISMTALGTLDTLANFGLCVRFSSSAPATSNYIDYLIAGNDDKNGWTGGFKCFVVDPTLTPSRINGTQSSIIASVLCVGVWIDCSTSARADSIFIDQIAVGSGIRITGTSTTAISDTVTYCTDYTTARAWGMWQEREGISFTYGKTYVGDAVSQIANVSFEDTGAIVQFGISEYYETGAWKSSMGVDAHGIVVEDHTSYTTIFTDGILVGSDNGRSGSLFLGNTQQNVSLDVYGGNHANSVTSLYSTSFKNFSGTLVSGDDANHVFYGVTFEGCNQFDPVGAPVIRNCNFISMWDDGVADASNNSALLWNSSIDIENCNFLANSHATSDVAHGIEHTSIPGVATGTVTTADVTGVTLTDSTASFLTTAAVNDIAYNETDLSYGTITSVDSNTQVTLTALANGTDNQWDSADAYSVTTPVTYTDLIFSGNELDVHNSTTDALVISKSGSSNPSTNTGIVVYQGSVTVSFEVIDKTGAAIQDVRITAYLTSDDTEIINTVSNASGIASASYSGATPADFYYRYRKSSTGSQKYFNLSGLGTIESGTGSSVKRTMQEDDIADPTI